MTRGKDPARWDAQAPIVVGVDGSPSAQDALDWAAAEATAMGRPLHIVHGFSWPLMGVPLGPANVGPPDGGFQTAARALLDRTQDAELVVVGSRGLGGFAGLLVGSVGVEVAAHASCPVVVVRARPANHPHPSASARRVVVGADGSELSAAAIGFAFQAPARRGAADRSARLDSADHCLSGAGRRQDQER